LSRNLRDLVTEADPNYERKWNILPTTGMRVFPATINGGIVNIGLNTLV
jgi:hypothetical protein